MNRLKRLIQDLAHRRVPHFLAAYLAAGWALLEFTDFLVNHYNLSPYLTDFFLLAWALMMPSVLVVAWYRGAPGRDRGSKIEKIGVPTNVLLAAVLLIATFSGKDLGVVTREITVADEAGNPVKRVVPKSEFRKRIALFYFENTGADSTLDWLQIGIPQAIETDLLQDIFMVVRPCPPFKQERLREAGYFDGMGVPLALRRDVAEELHLDFIVSGTVSGSVDSLNVSVTLHDASRGRLLSEHNYTGSDLFELVDHISLRLKRDLEVPAGHIEEVRDLPVAELLTESVPAFKAFVDGRRAWVTDDWQAAASSFTDATKIDSTFAYASAILLQASFLVNDMEGAARAGEAAMQHSYKLPEPLQFGVRSYYYEFVRQDRPKALAVATMHAELYPEDQTAHWLLMLLYELTGERDKRIAEAKRWLDVDPGDNDLLRLIGRLYKEQGAYEQAEVYYERYASKLPEDWRAFAELGDLSRITGEHGHALEYYGRALILDPGNTETLASIARTETSLGHFESAEQHLEEARGHAATPWQEFGLLDALRWYYERRGQMRLAIETMERAWAALDVASMPFFSAYIKLTQLGTYIRAGRADLAAVALGDISSSLSPPYDKASSFGQAIIAQEAWDAEVLEESLAGMERSIASLGWESMRPAIMFGRGRLLEMQGDCEQAIIAYERALELQPTDGDVNIDIGRCYRALENFDMAKSHLRKAIALDPFDPMARLELARVYADEGDREAASEHLRTALDVWSNADPEFKPAQQAKDIYAELSGN